MVGLKNGLHLIQFVTSKTRQVAIWRHFLIITRGKAPAGGFKFEVQVNGVIYGPPDVVSFFGEHAMQNFIFHANSGNGGEEEGESGVRQIRLAQSWPALTSTPFG